MKQRSIWILGTILTVSLLTTAPALAASKGGKARIPAARRHHVTQISDRDVVLSQNPLARGGRLIRLATFENGRQVLTPNPDAQRQVVVPNPSAE